MCCNCCWEYFCNDCDNNHNIGDKKCDNCKEFQRYYYNICNCGNIIYFCTSITFYARFSPFSSKKNRR